MSDSSIEEYKKQLGPFSDYFFRYIQLVDEGNIRQKLIEQRSKATDFLRSIDMSKLDYRYAEGKWTIKEVLQHIIDAERVFAYRALAFARQDTNALPSFDENKYAQNSHASSRKWEDLIAEFDFVRKSTELLFSSFTEEDLRSTGTASGNEISVLALGYIAVGHVTHHINIIKERYL